MRKKIRKRNRMTKIYLTEKQQAQLKCNPYVQTGSEKVITYTDEFKRHLLQKTRRENYHETFLQMRD